MMYHIALLRSSESIAQQRVGHVSLMQLAVARSLAGSTRKEKRREEREMRETKGMTSFKGPKVPFASSFTPLTPLTPLQSNPLPFNQVACPCSPLE